ncbi:DUF4376 domain-containing protein [Pseudomonas baltica]|uniref:DUF4376 domain-containing protein n=1 Tax=Pseudomonas baltica TaxID=2762576 RepID=UPI00289DD04A|nr:DUF4376 domain-containing protein [Pseudomonas baltica]
MPEVVHYADRTTGAYLYATDEDPPSNSVVVTAPLSSTYIWDGTVWVSPGPTSDEIEAERDRRVSAGFEFTVDGASYTIQSRSSDRENILGAAGAAFRAQVGGKGAGDYLWDGTGEEFAWITADNQRVKMDAPTVVALGDAAIATKQRLIYKARGIKDMSPLPSNYTDDKWWG